MTRSLPTLADIGPDVPLRLAAAAAIAYPDGSMGASGLRAEARKGRLVIERVAGKYYTTLGHIKRMRELCRVAAPKDPACGSARNATTAADGAPTMPRGSSSIEAARSALDATLASLERRNGG